MEVEIVKFHPKHLEISDVREQEINGILKLPDSYERIKILSEIGESITIIYDGRIITCCGFIEVWSGVCEVWQIPSVYITDKPILFARIIKRYLDRLVETFKWHRMQTTSLNDELHRRWMKWLGFEREGLLRRYSYDKQDYVQWGKLFQWQH